MAYSKLFSGFFMVRMKRVKNQDEEGKGPGDQEDRGTKGPRAQGTRGPPTGSGEPFPLHVSDGFCPPRLTWPILFLLGAWIRRHESVLLCFGTVFFPFQDGFPCDGFVGYSYCPLVQSASKLEAWTPHLAEILDFSHK